MRVAGPDLMPVHQEMVALQHRPGAQAGKVGSGFRFRIALAPADFAPHDRRDMGLPLLLGAVFQQDGTQHGKTHAAQRDATAEVLHFFFQDQRFFAGQAAAAVALRPCWRRPALGRHPIQPDFLLGPDVSGLLAAGDLLILRHEAAHDRRAVFLEPGARIGAEVRHGWFLGGFPRG